MATEVTTKTSRGAWIRTSEMCEELGCHRNTLHRLRTSGFLRENHHWRRVNPESDSSTLVWHRPRTLLRMGAD